MTKRSEPMDTESLGKLREHLKAAHDISADWVNRDNMLVLVDQVDAQQTRIEELEGATERLSQELRRVDPQRRRPDDGKMTERSKCQHEQLREEYTACAWCELEARGEAHKAGRQAELADVLAWLRGILGVSSDRVILPIEAGRHVGAAMREDSKS